jgi:hypothetical protein
VTGPPGSPPSGWAPVPVAPRRRLSPGWAVGLVVAAIVVVLGVATALVALARTTTDILIATTAGPDTGPAQKAASAYAKALVEHRFAEAQQMFCARDKAVISPASLAEHFFRPQLTDFRVERVAVARAQGTRIGRAAVRFTTATGLYHSTDLPLVEENGTWRPCP